MKIDDIDDIDACIPATTDTLISLFNLSDNTVYFSNFCNTFDEIYSHHLKNM